MRLLLLLSMVIMIDPLTQCDKKDPRDPLDLAYQEVLPSCDMDLNETDIPIDCKIC